MKPKIPHNFVSEVTDYRKMWAHENLIILLCTYDETFHYLGNKK